MNCQSRGLICRGNVRWDRNSDSTAAAKQEEQNLLRRRERMMNMAGTLERDSLSIVLGRPEKSTEVVSRRNYKWKLQTSTSKYDSKTKRLKMIKYWAIIQEE